MFRSWNKFFYKENGPPKEWLSSTKNGFYRNQLQGEAGRVIERIDKQNSRFGTAKTTIIKFGLYSSFVELDSTKSALNETEDDDLPSAMEFLKNRKDFFKDLRLDTALNEMLCYAREFPHEIGIPANFELTQPRRRVRRRNVNCNYEAREDPTLKYKAEFYFFTLDKAINALESRREKISSVIHEPPFRTSSKAALELQKITRSLAVLE
ncbi:uncharacterized protein TNCV_74991 [Trichonephila clavipes]|nr:uncharacterized protein TNCV_74991 [Trichonephila clavipes]